MTREELIGINAGIVKRLKMYCHSPNAIIVVVSNHGYNDVFGFKSTITKNRIIGMGGALIALF
jgi:malate/lactate dehydrogenase